MTSGVRKVERQLWLPEVPEYPSVRPEDVVDVAEVLPTQEELDAELDRILLEVDLNEAVSVRGKLLGGEL